MSFSNGFFIPIQMKSASIKDQTLLITKVIGLHCMCESNLEEGE